MINKQEDWMNRKWRPVMAWMYMVICTADFLIFPILWSVFKAYHGQEIDAWDPLTLKGAGLFHMAMGAVLGITAWTRGREKVAMYQTRQYQTDDEEYDEERVKPRKSPKPPKDPLI